MKSLRPKSASTSKEVKQFLRVLKEKKAYYQNIDEEILMPQFPRHRQAKIKKEDLAKDFLKEKINKLKLEINEQATVICIQEISALKVKINKSKFWNLDKANIKIQNFQSSKPSNTIISPKEDRALKSINQAKQEIQALQYKIKENEKIITRKNHEIIAFQNRLDESPSVLKLDQQRVKVRDKLEATYKELETRKNLENLLLNGYDHASISKSPKNEEYKVITILSTLENWDNAPEIVKKHLIEQENSQKELEHIIAKLEKELEEKRKCFIQKEFDLSFARLEESWKKEWENKVNLSISGLKNSKEKEIKELKFEKKLLEIQSSVARMEGKLSS